MASFSHYEILGVSKTATLSEIKSAYRKMMRQVHPDTGGNGAMFGMVQEAYRVLSDSKLRSDYDYAQSFGDSNSQSSNSAGSQSAPSDSHGGASFTEEERKWQREWEWKQNKEQQAKAEQERKARADYLGNLARERAERAEQDARQEEAAGIRNARFRKIDDRYRIIYIATAVAILVLIAIMDSALTSNAEWSGEGARDLGRWVAITFIPNVLALYFSQFIFGFVGTCKDSEKKKAAIV